MFQEQNLYCTDTLASRVARPSAAMVKTRLEISTIVTTHHDDVIKWKPFPRYWPFVWGIHRSPVSSPHKNQWRGAWVFSSICAWTNGWVNNRDIGDLRRHCAHHDVTVMITIIIDHKLALVFHETGLQLPTPSQVREILKNANRFSWFFLFFVLNSARKGLMNRLVLLDSDIGRTIQVPYHLCKSLIYRKKSVRVRFSHQQMIEETGWCLQLCPKWLQD